MTNHIRILGLCLLLAPRLSAGITVIANAMAGAVGTTTATLNCAGANWISVVVSEYYANFTSQPMTGTVTSVPANTWTCNPSRADGGNSQLELCYADSASVANGMTVTYTPTDQAHIITVVPVCASGVAAPSQDKYHANSGLQVLHVGPITPAVDGELVITGVTSDETTGTSNGWHAYEPLGGTYHTTSTTSITPANGTLTFTVGAGLTLTPGQPVLVDSVASAAFIFGTITSYSGTTLVMSATEFNGTVRTDWTIDQVTTNYTLLQHRQLVGSGGGAGDAIAVASWLQTAATTTDPIWDGMFSGPGLVASFMAATRGGTSMDGKITLTGKAGVQ